MCGKPLNSTSNLSKMNKNAVNDLPAELQEEVDNLAQLNDMELWEVACGTFPSAKRRLYDKLLARNSATALTTSERSHLKELRLESEILTLRKAQAYVLLRQRGYPIGPLEELPLPD